MKKSWLFLFLIPIFLIVLILHSWFDTGLIISNNSEENLNILSPSRTTSHYSNIWWSVGTGAPNPFFLPRASVFWTLSFLEMTSVPPFLIQAIFLGILMFIGMAAIYALTKYGFNFNSFVSGVSSLFYLLNIYSLTQVWKRFLYNGMIAWAYLPLFLLFWFKWILENKLKWLLAFLISSLIFTYTFAHPAYFLTFWIPAGILVLIKAWEIRSDSKRLLKLFGFSLLGFFLWIVVNVWWLYPAILLSRSWIGENLPQTEINLNILTAVSRSFPLNEILLLRQSWYLSPDNDFGNSYNNPAIYLISIAVLGLVIIGFIKLKKNKNRKYLTGLALVGLFVSKGSNFPLGFIFYQFLFSTFPFTAALRNSYEKFGLVWLLPYAIFFAYGVYGVYHRIKDGFKRAAFIALTLFLSCGLLVYPMWNGDIFPPKHRVEVPSYYNEVNQFLISQKTERYFHIPFLTEGNKMTYDWGYVGEEPSDNIFDSENLSSAYVPLYNKTLKLLTGYFDNKNASNIFGLLGVQYTIFQKDIVDPKIDFEKTQKQIESWKGISRVKTFGKIDLYLLDPKIIKPKIYASGNVVEVNSLGGGLNYVTSDKWDKTSVFTFQDTGTQLRNSLIPHITYTKLFNTRYQVNIKESSGPFILVLNNTYDQLWKARIDNLVLEKHFMVNGFANGWLVDKTGNFQIEINLKVWPWE